MYFIKNYYGGKAADDSSGLQALPVYVVLDAAELEGWSRRLSTCLARFYLEKIREITFHQKIIFKKSAI